MDQDVLGLHTVNVHSKWLPMLITRNYQEFSCISHLKDSTSPPQHSPGGLVQRPVPPYRLTFTTPCFSLPSNN